MIRMERQWHTCVNAKRTKCLKSICIMRKIELVTVFLALFIITTAVLMRVNRNQKDFLVNLSCKDEVNHVMKWADKEVQGVLGLSSNSLDVYSSEDCGKYLESRRYKCSLNLSNKSELENFKFQFLSRGDLLKARFPNKHIRCEISANEEILSFLFEVEK